MRELQVEYGVVRVYETRKSDGNVTLRLKDRAIELGAREFTSYAKLVEWLSSTRPRREIEASLAMTPARLERFVNDLEQAGLVYRTSRIPAQLTGEEFHRDYFAKFLPAWLDEAFSHSFWERMMTGKGSARLYTGWLFELYHYTRNANRHMPLSCAHTHSKPIKALRAKTCSRIRSAPRSSRGPRPTGARTARITTRPPSSTASREAP